MSRYVIALYIRLSMEDGKYDSLSIEHQKMILHNYVLSMPEADDADVQEFIDNGYSGTNFERPAIQKLLEMVRANEIDCIIVKDFSRLGRNSLETGYFIERVFPLFHTRFIAVNEAFDTAKLNGDTGGMEVAFKYLINEYYSRDMSMKTKTAKYAKMQRGEYQSKICPYGYRKSVEGRMEPDPDAADVVKLIFELAADGISGTEIARQLTARHIPTPGEYKAAHGNHTHDITRAHGVWSGSTVLRILSDERYIGTYIIGKRAVIDVGATRSRLKDRDKWIVISDHHPAIVSKELFDTAQAKLTHFKLKSRKNHEYPLKGKMFCGCCDHALTRTRNNRNVFYCRHSLGIQRLACNGKKYPAPDVEKAVFDTVKKQVEVLFPNGQVDCAAKADSGTHRYDEQIANLENQKMSLYEQYVSGVLALDEYKQQKASCDTEILQCRNIRAAALTQQKKADQLQEAQTKHKEILCEIASATSLSQAMVDMLIDRVYVYPDNKIEIKYSVQDIFE